MPIHPPPKAINDPITVLGGQGEPIRPTALTEQHTLTYQAEPPGWFRSFADRLLYANLTDPTSVIPLAKPGAVYQESQTTNFMPGYLGINKSTGLAEFKPDPNYDATKAAATIDDNLRAYLNRREIDPDAIAKASKSKGEFDYTMRRAMEIARLDDQIARYDEDSNFLTWGTTKTLSAVLNYLAHDPVNYAAMMTPALGGAAIKAGRIAAGGTLLGIEGGVYGAAQAASHQQFKVAENKRRGIDSDVDLMAIGQGAAMGTILGAGLGGFFASISKSLTKKIPTAKDYPKVPVASNTGTLRGSLDEMLSHAPTDVDAMRWEILDVVMGQKGQEVAASLDADIKVGILDQADVSLEEAHRFFKNGGTYEDFHAITLKRRNVAEANNKALDEALAKHTEKVAKVHEANDKILAKAKANEAKVVAYESKVAEKRALNESKTALQEQVTYNRKAAKTYLARLAEQTLEELTLTERLALARKAAGRDKVGSSPLFPQEVWSTKIAAIENDLAKVKEAQTLTVRQHTAHELSARNYEAALKELKKTKVPTGPAQVRKSFSFAADPTFVPPRPIDLPPLLVPNVEKFNRIIRLGKEIDYKKQFLPSFSGIFDTGERIKIALKAAVSKEDKAWLTKFQSNLKEWNKLDRDLRTAQAPKTTSGTPATPGEAAKVSRGEKIQKALSTIGLGASSDPRVLKSRNILWRNLRRFVNVGTLQEKTAYSDNPIVAFLANLFEPESVRVNDYYKKGADDILTFEGWKSQAAHYQSEVNTLREAMVRDGTLEEASPAIFSDFFAVRTGQVERDVLLPERYWGHYEAFSKIYDALEKVHTDAGHTIEKPKTFWPYRWLAEHIRAQFDDASEDLRFVYEDLFMNKRDMIYYPAMERTGHVTKAGDEWTMTELGIREMGEELPTSKDALPSHVRAAYENELRNPTGALLDEAKSNLNKVVGGEDVKVMEFTDKAIADAELDKFVETTNANMGRQFDPEVVSHPRLQKWVSFDPQVASDSFFRMRLPMLFMEKELQRLVGADKGEYISIWHVVAEAHKRAVLEAKNNPKALAKVRDEFNAVARHIGYYQGHIHSTPGITQGLLSTGVDLVLGVSRAISSPFWGAGPITTEIPRAIMGSAGGTRGWARGLVDFLRAASRENRLEDLRGTAHILGEWAHNAQRYVSDGLQDIGSGHSIGDQAKMGFRKAGDYASGRAIPGQALDTDSRVANAARQGLHALSNLNARLGGLGLFTQMGAVPIASRANRTLARLVKSGNLRKMAAEFNALVDPTQASIDAVARKYGLRFDDLIEMNTNGLFTEKFIDGIEGPYAKYVKDDGFLHRDMLSDSFDAVNDIIDDDLSRAQAAISGFVHRSVEKVIFTPKAHSTALAFDSNDVMFKFLGHMGTYMRRFEAQVIRTYGHTPTGKFISRIGFYIMAETAYNTFRRVAVGGESMETVIGEWENNPELTFAKSVAQVPMLGVWTSMAFSLVNQAPGVSAPPLPGAGLGQFASVMKRARELPRKMLTGNMTRKDWSFWSRSVPLIGTWYIQTLLRGLLGPDDKPRTRRSKKGK